MVICAFYMTRNNKDDELVINDHLGCDGCWQSVFAVVARIGRCCRAMTIP